MPHDRIEKALASELSRLAGAGTRKGRETVIAGLIPASGGKGQASVWKHPSVKSGSQPSIVQSAPAHNCS